MNTRVIRYGKVSRVRLMYISLMKTDEKRPLWCPVTQELWESRRQTKEVVVRNVGTL